MLLLDAETFRWLKSTPGSLPRGLSSSVTTGAGSLDLAIQQMYKVFPSLVDIQCKQNSCLQNYRLQVKAVTRLDLEN